MLSLSLAFAVGAAAVSPAHALDITDRTSVNTAVEFDTSGNVVQEDHADTTSGDTANARVELGDGKNAFNETAFSQAVTAFRGDQATYWVEMNADNSGLDNRGIGAAGVDLTYHAIKQPGDTAFTLHTTGGFLHLADPEEGSDPLSALVELDAFVLHGSDILKHFSARAELFGNGGPSQFPDATFRLRSNGFDIHPGDFGFENDLHDTNIIGAHLVLQALDIPVDLTNIVDGTPITIEVTLNGEVRAPGEETIAYALFRDPTHAGDADPFAGGSTITFETGGAPPGVPEPPTAALVGAAMLAGWAAYRRGWIASL
jgi:hypothetical protein